MVGKNDILISFSFYYSDRRMKREGWVTFGRDEGEVKNALILLRSLRHQFTNKQVILILSRNVPEDLWYLNMN